MVDETTASGILTRVGEHARRRRILGGFRNERTPTVGRARDRATPPPSLRPGGQRARGRKFRAAG